MEIETIPAATLPCEPPAVEPPAPMKNGIGRGGRYTARTKEID